MELDVAFVGGPRTREPGLLPVCEVFLAGAQDVPDPIERIVLAATVAVDLLLHPATDVVDDVECVENGAGVLERVCPELCVTGLA